MVKTITKFICLVASLLSWVALLIIAFKMENETCKSCAIIALMGLAYVFLRLYFYINMYQKCEKMYDIIKKTNRKRLLHWYEGDTDKTQECIEKMQIAGDELLEVSGILMQTFRWLPKKRLNKMAQDTQNMMRREYPPI